MDTSYRAAQRAAALDPTDTAAQTALARAAERLGFSLVRSTPDNHPDMEEIASMSEDGMSYSFHYMIAWRHVPTGRVFWGEDSGCSCPSPFENEWLQYDGARIDTSLTEVTRASRHAFAQAVDGFPADYGERGTFRNKVENKVGDSLYQEDW